MCVATPSQLWSNVWVLNMTFGFNSIKKIKISRDKICEFKKFEVNVVWRGYPTCFWLYFWIFKWKSRHVWLPPSPLELPASVKDVNWQCHVASKSKYFFPLKDKSSISILVNCDELEIHDHESIMILWTPFRSKLRRRENSEFDLLVFCYIIYHTIPNSC